MDKQTVILEKMVTTLLSEKKYPSLRDILVTMNPSDIAGLFDALEEVQSAGSLAKAALDEETDRVEEETRLLEIDPKAEKESLTSSENKTPDSLQIILRTEEIQSEEEEPEMLDAEGQAPKEGLVTRILNVFRKIFEAVRDIFAEA